MYVITPVADLSLSAGAERAQVAICRELAALGHDIHVVYQTDGWFRDQWAQFAKAIDPLSSGVTGLRQLHDVIARQRVGGEKPVVYAHHNGFWSNLAVGFAGKAFGPAPLVLHMHLPHGGNVRLPSIVFRRLSRIPDVMVFVSEDTRRSWEAAGAAPRTGATVGNGVDTALHVPGSDHQRAKARERFSIPHESFVVLMLGRLVEEKGVGVLLRAWRRLTESGDAGRMHLLLVGTPGSPTVSSAIGQSPQTTSVPWLRDVDDAYNASDTVVVPSTWSEPNPLTVLEALAREKTVIWSTAGGIPEALGDWGARNEEWAVPPGAEEALAAALLKMPHLPLATRIALGRDGRAYVQRHRSVRACATTMEQVLRQANAGAPTESGSRYR